MRRETSLNQLCQPDKIWDIAIIGGGATGVGIAVDAAARGYSTCLVEQSDFGKATSSRSTKLVHGGVRYLRQGNIPLVMRALRERGILRQNAPHLVHERAFIIPNYAWWEAPYYGIGLKVYDLLAGRCGFGKSRHLSRQDVLERIPTLQPAGLRGGVLYHDGQFDDARLLIHLAMTADAQGAALVNYAPVVSLSHDSAGFIDGFSFVDLETNSTHSVRARVVVNATGAFCDAIRRLDDPRAEPIVTPSQGVHITLDRSFLPGESAIMVPRTSDCRVMFAIPWHDHVVVGTTDTHISTPTLEPAPMDREIDFILQTAGRYLARPPTRGDIRSVFAGIRPLVNGTRGVGASTNTATLSRDHTIAVSKSNLLTITGGKWTTYRHMAEDCVNRAAKIAGLAERPCPTRDLHIHGYHENAEEFGPLGVYGSHAADIQQFISGDPAMAAPLHDRLPIVAAQVVWAVRQEMARTVEDVLARRTRALMLDAGAAGEMALAVAKLVAAERGLDAEWELKQVEEFRSLAGRYQVG